VPLLAIVKALKVLQFKYVLGIAERHIQCEIPRRFSESAQLRDSESLRRRLQLWMIAD